MNPANNSAGAPALPADFDAQAGVRYAALKDPCIAFDQFLATERSAELQRLALKADPAMAYRPQLLAMTPCGNGDFEPSLVTSEWQFAYGPRPALSAPHPCQALFSGLSTGVDIHDPATRHTWVSAVADPIAPILCTPPGAAHAIRIGNAVSGAQCELISKTFVVTPAQATISFWYAVVFQDPGHAPTDQPCFWVRVTDALDQVITGAIDLGFGDGMVISRQHPFFNDVPGLPAGHAVRYKDWSCAQIDLSSHIGQQVTLEFITADCALGAHWGYAYVGNVCGSCAGSPTGSFSYACEASDHCGPGKICFDYSLPTTVDAQGVAVAGEVSIQLELIQNGVTVLTLSSGMLIRGERYCFAIDPAQLPGVNPAFGGFDIRATASFSMGQVPLGRMVAGTPQEGVTVGRNNDYRLRCPSCDEIGRNQAEQLRRRCATKRKHLSRVSCHCPPGSAGGCGCGGGCSESRSGRGAAGLSASAVAAGGPVPNNVAPVGSAGASAPILEPATRTAGCDCQGHCECQAVTWPLIKPCLSVAWADSDCDGLHGSDVEVMCISVCNCHSNLSFTNLVIQQIQVTDANGRPVAMLPDGTPSIQVVPSGPVCFGDIGPCRGKDQPSCVTRELAVLLRGAAAGNYRLSFGGICFDVVHHVQDEQCFDLPVCKD